MYVLVVVTNPEFTYGIGGPKMGKVGFQNLVWSIRHHQTSLAMLGWINHFQLLRLSETWQIFEKLQFQHF